MSEPTKARVPAMFTAPLPVATTEPPPVAAALRALALLPAEGGPTVQACRTAAAELLTDYFRAEAEAARCGPAGVTAGILGGLTLGGAADGFVPPAPVPQHDRTPLRFPAGTVEPKPWTPNPRDVDFPHVVGGAN